MEGEERTPLQAALHLAEEMGYPVFPCREDKTPYTEHGFKDASRSIEQIIMWWTEHPNALIGVPTGAASGLFVYDIDTKGMLWLKANRDKFAGCSRTNRTLHDGRHLCYQMPKNGGNWTCTASVIAPGVDTRGEGGYIIWWPAHGFRAYVTGEELTLPPVEIPKKKTETPSGNGEAGAKYSEGERHSVLLTRAGQLRRRGLRGAELLAALLAWNQEHCNPPQDEADVRKIAGDYEGKEGGKEPEPPEPAPEVVTTFDSIAATTYIAERPLIGDWLHSGAWMLVGDKKIGKSFLGLQADAGVASGGKFLDWQCQQGEILLIGTEDDEPLLQGRLAQLGIANGPAFPPPKGCYVVTGDELKRLAKHHNHPDSDNRLSLELWLHLWLKDHPRVRLVTLDTLDIAETIWSHGTVSHQGHKITQVDYLQTAAWHSFARRHRIVIFLVCHTAKLKGRHIDNPFELQNATNTKAAGAGGQIVLWNPKVTRPGDEEGGIKQYVLSMEGRQIPGGDRHFAVHRNSLGQWVNDGLWAAVKQTELERELMEALRELCEEQGAKRDALFTSPQIASAAGMKAPNVKRALSRMIEAGRMTYGQYRVVRRFGATGGYRLDPTKGDKGDA